MDSGRHHSVCRPYAKNNVFSLECGGNFALHRELTSYASDRLVMESCHYRLSDTLGIAEPHPLLVTVHMTRLRLESLFL